MCLEHLFRLTYPYQWRVGQIRYSLMFFALRPLLPREHLIPCELVVCEIGKRDVLVCRIVLVSLFVAKLDELPRKVMEIRCVDGFEFQCHFRRWREDEVVDEQMLLDNVV